MSCIFPSLRPHRLRGGFWLTLNSNITWKDPIPELLNQHLPFPKASWRFPCSFKCAMHGHSDGFHMCLCVWQKSESSGPHRAHRLIPSLS